MIADVDFCISLGGDGTVLHLTTLFAEDQPLPPVASFALGTLGFLTPFDIADFESCLSRVLDANASPVYCTLRTRKRCDVYRWVLGCAQCLDGNCMWIWQGLLYPLLSISTSIQL